MKTSRYEFDPQSDVELCLCGPKQELVPSLTIMKLNIIELREAGKEFQAEPERQPVSVFGSRSTTLEQQRVSSPQAPSTLLFLPQRILPTTTTALPVVGRKFGHSDTNIITPSSQPGRIRMMVSSRHLILASTYFREMLNGPWKEGTMNDNAPRSITASDWDEGALVIVMDIIHGHNREVPKHMTLELLSEIAVIVDYYDCHEAVEPFVGHWITMMKQYLPNRYGKNCILWIVVSWVFSQNKIFESMTELATKYGEELVKVPALPIGQILGK
ncbi:hypothetical protein S40293_07634 [Stachybotrys chartarum IBT 40293]|nr:hypothetical protein S40293_07634 [Stachybotrys chartarum IBT 40293]